MAPTARGGMGAPYEGLWDSSAAHGTPVPRQQMPAMAGGGLPGPAIVDIVVGLAAVKVLGPLANGYGQRLGELLAESTDRALQRLRLRRRPGNRAQLEIAVGPVPTIVQFSEPMSDEAKLALLDLDPRDPRLVGRTVYWHALLGAWLVDGEPRDAIIRLHAAIDRTTAQHGAQHPDVLRLRADLARSHAEAGDTELAVQLYLDVLGPITQVLGEHGRDAALLRGDLARVYGALADYERAIPLYQQAVNDAGTLLGAGDERYVVLANNLAVAYHSAGQPERAKMLLERTLHSARAALGSGHPHVRVLEANLAAV